MQVLPHIVNGPDKACRGPSQIPEIDFLSIRFNLI
jgi:hypothetical protein